MIKNFKIPQTDLSLDLEALTLEEIFKDNSLPEQLAKVMTSSEGPGEAIQIILKSENVKLLVYVASVGLSEIMQNFIKEYKDLRRKGDFTDEG